MDVRRLQLLRELSERGTVTAVAAATHRTASAVSQQLKILEREAGAPLVERSGRGVVLTSAGRELVRTATDVAVALERTEALWKKYTAAPLGEVSLTTFPTGGQMLIPGVLRAIAGESGLSLNCTDLDAPDGDYAELTADYDIVIADAPGFVPSWRDRGLAVVPLMNEPLDVALAPDHPLASNASLSPRDVADATWIGLPYQRILDQIDAVNGTTSIVTQRFNANSIVEAVVAAGHGLAILPRYTTRAHMNGLVTRPLTGVRARRQISAIMRRERAERPSVQRVVEALRVEAGIVQELFDAPADSTGDAGA